MKVEIEALEKHNTWELVKLPEGKKNIGCKWVFTVKYKFDGSLERYKTRLVTKGYSQTYGTYYLEMFAPVAKMNTMRVLFSIAANQGWRLQQFNVKNAFLHGDLEEEVYMDTPPGFNSSDRQAGYLSLNKLGCKSMETPIDANHKLGDSMDDSAVDRGSYQRLMGMLIYLSHQAGYCLCSWGGKSVHA
ncbi:hypothetical protein GQ457_01G023480 [Hibiscus cannabinus]